MAYLTSITIAFYTPIATDGKAETTRISVLVYDLTHTVVARKDKFAGNLPLPDDGSFTHVFNLDIINKIDKNDFIHGSFDVVITPVGGDTWVFIPYLLITFSDGSIINCNTYDNRIVSELATTTSFAF